jgi:Xaa-Pro aminopeptidase
MNERIKRLISNFPETIDAALITSAVNRQYYSGFSSSSGVLLITRQNARLIVDFRYYEAAKREVRDLDVLLLKNEGDQIQKLLCDENAVNIGFETKYATVQDYLYWKKSLPNLTLQLSNSLSELISKQRRIKTAHEIALMKNSQNIVDRCFLEILNMIKPGVSEKEIAVQLSCLMRKMGAEKEAFDIIALTGSNTSMPHGVPSDRIVVQGDFFLMDFGVNYRGYCSDMTRTVAVGYADDEKQKVYQIVLSAQKAAINAIKTENSCKTVDEAARKLIDSSGYQGCFGHSTGHSLGLEIHEEPSFSFASLDDIEPGLVMSVEPGIYIGGSFGCRIEDVVHITEHGAENLTGAPKELIVL